MILKVKKLLNNEVRLNKTGIDVISGGPYIINNIIDKNYKEGIHTYCYKNYRYHKK